MGEEFSLEEMHARLKKVQRKADKAFLHGLVENLKRTVKDMPLTDDNGKGKCVKCGKRKKLGQRGKCRGVCKKCKRKG